MQNRRRTGFRPDSIHLRGSAGKPIAAGHGSVPCRTTQSLGDCKTPFLETADVQSVQKRATCDGIWSPLLYGLDRRVCPREGFAIT